MLRRPLYLKEDSSVAGKLRMANTVLRFEQNAQWHSKNKVFSKSFPIGCKLFVFNSQRNNISYKLAQKWQGHFICIQHLENNNILIKPIGGNKLLKIHINNCKKAGLSDEHLRLNADYLKEQFKQLGKSSTDTPDKLIVPNYTFEDDFPTIAQPDIPNIPPPFSPAHSADKDNSAESDQPDDTFASADNN